MLAAQRATAVQTVGLNILLCIKGVLLLTQSHNCDENNSGALYTCLEDSSAFQEGGCLGMDVCKCFWELVPKIHALG